MLTSRAEKQERAETAATLRELSPFAGVEPADLSALAASGRVLRLPQGWCLIASETPADAAYVRSRAGRRSGAGAPSWPSSGRAP